MKKILSLILFCIFALSVFACGTSTDPDETTTNLIQSKETTSAIVKSEKTTSNIIKPTETTVETTTDPIVILNKLSKVPSIAVELNGKRQDLFSSFVYARANSGAAADGVLSLRSFENVLGYWVSEDKIPTIILDTKSKLVNTESDVVLTDTVTFHIYEEVNGTYRKITSIKNATISDLYNYGVNNLRESNSYIYFDISVTIDGGNATYAYIMRANFASN